MAEILPAGARVVCQFSCGAASAVATKLALAEFGASHEVVIVNAFIREEHPDNRRFLADCETWFGRKVHVLRDEKYGASTIAVFLAKRYMKGPKGAPCSMLLKRRLLASMNRADDVMVLGFTVEEAGRFADFRVHNPGRTAIAPLIEAGLTKSDVKEMVLRAGIELPLMYRLGYSNANCRGCVKGGEAYFRAIKLDFPEEFEELAAAQEAIGPGAYLFRDRKTGVRYGLRDIPPGRVSRDDDLPSCSFYCEAAERLYAKQLDDAEVPNG